MANYCAGWLEQMQGDAQLINIASAIDRNLPVPLGVQLRGLLEYGIACGELPVGVRLPSVRELSETCGLAPMTVAAVYRDLRSAGLLTARPGAGTFVAASAQATSLSDTTILALHTQIDQMIAHFRSAGLGPADLLAMINARVALGRSPRLDGLLIRVVGVFPSATRAYAEDIARYLRAGDHADFITIDELAASAPSARPVDMYVTMANRRAEVAAVVGHGIPVVSINFIPSETTRALLAKIDPLAQVCVVSVFPEFLALMRPGVMRFTPHVQSVDAALLGDVALGERLAGANVVVYATGAEAALTHLPPHVTAIEYRHVPDPHAIQGELLPMIERLRTSTPLQENLHENQPDELVTG